MESALQQVNTVLQVVLAGQPQAKTLLQVINVICQVVEVVSAKLSSPLTSSQKMDLALQIGSQVVTSMQTAGLITQSQADKANTVLNAAELAEPLIEGCVALWKSPSVQAMVEVITSEVEEVGSSCWSCCSGKAVVVAAPVVPVLVPAVTPTAPIVVTAPVVETPTPAPIEVETPVGPPAVLPMVLPALVPVPVPAPVPVNSVPTQVVECDIGLPSVPVLVE